jgi:antitoxin (DNA-binding transcriptional repressor) of toxin-antitoxin stability system
LSHMVISVRDLHSRTGHVVDAGKAGELVTLTLDGEPVADVVPRGHRVRWLSGAGLREQLQDRAADGGLRRELGMLVDDTLDSL